MYLLPIILLLIFLSIYASADISSGVYVKTICKADKQKDMISFTFDDGVDPEMTPKVLDVLLKHKVKGTFFLIGEKARLYPEIVKRILAEGHEIGNHSLSHKSNFPLQTSSVIKAQLSETNNILREISGSDPIYFRPPFGVTNPMIGKAVREMGFICIGWSIRSLDTMGRDINLTTERVLRNIKGGDIILLHDNRERADELLDNILNGCRDYNAVSISELIKNL